MARERHLSRPPIQEAVLDFGFDGSRLERDGLDQLASTFSPDRWKKETITTHTFEAEIDDSEGPLRPTATSAFEGYSIKELGGPRIVQLREDRLTVSHVLGYRQWEDLVRDASTEFEKFVAAGNPTSVTRLASRFINRIPMQSGSFADLLTISPQVLPGLGDARVTDFVRRQVIQGLEEGFSATLTVATVTPLPGETSNALLIDIDVSKQQLGWPPLFSEISSHFHVLRTIKNAIFFGSVTEFALEPYQ